METHVPTLLSWKQQSIFLFIFQVAVCNLASLALNKFVVTNGTAQKTYNFQKLFEVTQVSRKVTVANTEFEKKVENYHFII